MRILTDASKWHLIGLIVLIVICIFLYLLAPIWSFQNENALKIAAHRHERRIFNFSKASTSPITKLIASTSPITKAPAMTTQKACPLEDISAAVPPGVLNFSLPIIAEYCGGVKVSQLRVESPGCGQYLRENYRRNDILDNVARCKANSDTCLPVIKLYHMVWDGVIVDAVYMSILSFLLTNSAPFCGQPREFRRLILWHNFLSPNWNISREFEKLQPAHAAILQWALQENYLEIRRKDELFMNLTIHGDPITIASHASSTYKEMVKGSDLLRFIIMKKFPGSVYVDVDVIFLRDFTPLFALKRPFMTRWGLSTTPNTAVMYIPAEDVDIPEYLLDNSCYPKGPKGTLPPNGNLHPRKLLRACFCTQPNNCTQRLLILPVIFFDAVWYANDFHYTGKGKKVRPDKKNAPNSTTWPVTTQEHFFLPSPVVTAILASGVTAGQLLPCTTFENLIEGLHPGTFAYHWHNYWGASCWGPKNSFFTELCQYGTKCMQAIIGLT